METGEINKRAAKFKPRFKVTRQQVDFYRKTRAVDMQQIKQEEEFDALRSGLALREERVKVLQDLAGMLQADLLVNEKTMAGHGKGTGDRRHVQVSEFNAAEVLHLRGLLDDIATEVGDRVRRQESDREERSAPDSRAEIRFYGIVG